MMPHAIEQEAGLGSPESGAFAAGASQGPIDRHHARDHPLLILQGSHKEADGGGETPRDAPSKRTSSFSSLLTPRLSFSR